MAKVEMKAMAIIRNNEKLDETFPAFSLFGGGQPDPVLLAQVDEHSVFSLSG